MISPYKKNQHKKPPLLKGKTKIQHHIENLGAVERRKKNSDGANSVSVTAEAA